MPNTPDHRAENPTLKLSPDTIRGRQRLGMGLLSLGLSLVGVGTLAAGGLGYLNETPTVLLGGSLVAAGALGALNRSRI